MEEKAWDQATFLTGEWLLSVSDFLDLIVRGGSAFSLVLFNDVSEQICSHSVQAGENLNSSASTNEELLSILHKANDRRQQDYVLRSTCSD